MSKKLRGRLTHPESGIYFDLPPDWSGIYMDGMFLTESDQHLGGLDFFINKIDETYFDRKKKGIPTGLDTTHVKEGKYDTASMTFPIDKKRNSVKIWNRIAGIYEISIMYTYHLRYIYEMETVKKIIDSIVVPDDN